MSTDPIETTTPERPPLDRQQQLQALADARALLMSEDDSCPLLTFKARELAELARGVGEVLASVTQDQRLHAADPGALAARLRAARTFFPLLQRGYAGDVLTAAAGVVQTGLEEEPPTPMVDLLAGPMVSEQQAARCGICGGRIVAGDVLVAGERQSHARCVDAVAEHTGARR